MKGPQMNLDESAPGNSDHSPSNRLESVMAKAEPAQIKSVEQVHSPTEPATSIDEPQRMELGVRMFSWFVILGCGIGSGLLLTTCYFPMSVSWTAWFALVPLLLLTRSGAGKELIYFSVWMCGMVFYLPILNWLPEAGTINFYFWPPLAIYCTLYILVGFWCVRLIDRNIRVPMTIIVPVVWVGLEFVRSFMLTGFAWYYLGHSQHNVLPIIQVADVGGVYLVSFLIAMVNGLLVEALCFSPIVRSCLRFSEPTKDVPPKWSWAALKIQGAVTFVLLVSTFAYGMWRIDSSAFTQGPRVALLQGNVEQGERNIAWSKGAKARAARKKIQANYLQLCRMAGGLLPDSTKRFQVSDSGNVELIIWPETSSPFYWHDYEIVGDTKNLAPESFLTEGWRTVRNEALKGYGDLAALNCQANILLGVNTRVAEIPGSENGPGYKDYNSALLFRKDGSLGPRYDKVHRVPFGEYLPYSDTAFFKALNIYDYNYGIKAGKTMDRIDMDGYTFGVLICYEDTDPVLARQYNTHQKEGPPVNFLVNMSNDGWFRGSSEHNEHLAISRFRAIESRRSVVRSVNMGISAVIDSNGKVLRPQLTKTIDDIHFWEVPGNPVDAEALPISEWNNYKSNQGVLIATIPVDNRTSLYAMFGDWFAILCLVALFGAFIRSSFGPFVWNFLRSFLPARKPKTA